MTEVRELRHLTPQEAELMQEPISVYGHMWQDFIREYHPRDVRVLRANGLWELIPRKIDRIAFDMYDALKLEFQHIVPEPDHNDTRAIYTWSERLTNFCKRRVLEELVFVRWTAGDWELLLKR